METTLNYRYAAFAIPATLCVYVAFALLTGWEDYGLTARAENWQRWQVGRIGTVTAWLLIASVLLRYRRHVANWRSFLYSAIATSLAAIVIAPTLVSQSANYAVIAGSVACYAIVSGFLCITVKKPWTAGALGVILFPAQLFVDATTHVLLGIFRFH
jgi:hypothetical protein